MLLVSHFASRVSLASSFSLYLLQASRQFLSLAFHMAMMCTAWHTPICFGEGRLYIVPEGYLCILELVWWYGAQEFAYVREPAVVRCVLGLYGHPFYSMLWIYSFLNLSSQYHWFWDQCISESRLIQTPQVCVRFSFNFRHWLILFHQPIAISQRLGL